MLAFDAVIYYFILAASSNKTPTLK